MNTIRQVAKRAGVSVGTASHVMNGTVPVSKGLRKRVLDAIAEMDYQPNYVARSLATNSTKTLAIVIPDITLGFCAQMVRGADTVVSTQHYSLMTFNTDNDVEREKQVMSLLRARRVDGVLLVSALDRGSARHVQRTIDAGIPVVCLDRKVPGLDVDSVTTDLFAAARDCVQHLIAMGHREIAMITSPLVLDTVRDRLKGYKAALRAAGIPVSAELIKEGDFRQDAGFRLCEELLQSGKQKPSAIFVTNAVMTVGVLEALVKLGYRVPEDIALAAFNLAVPNVFRPAITAVMQPFSEIGRRGAELLLQVIRKERALCPVHVELIAELNLKESSLRPFTGSYNRSRTA